MTTAKALLFGLSVISLTSCDIEKILSEGEIPLDFQDYVSMHFPNNAVLQIIKEKSAFKTSYEVDIDENINLNFIGNKELASAQGNSPLHLCVLPKNLTDYVKLNYPNNVITRCLSLLFISIV